MQSFLTVGTRSSTLPVSLSELKDHLAVVGTNDDASMDPDVLGKSVTDTVAYCTDNKSTSVVNAVKAVAEE